MSASSLSKLSYKSLIKAIIFDVGSTMFYAVPKKVARQLDEKLTESLSNGLQWTEKDEQDFSVSLHHLYYEFEQRKKNVNTGTVLDEAYVDEPSVEDFVKRALPLMTRYQNKSREEMYELVAKDSKIIDRALAQYRQMRTDTVAPIEGFKDALQWALSNNYRCAICSNDNEAQRLYDTLEKYELRKHFDKVIISSELNLRKPDYRVVDPILSEWQEKYSIKASEVMFIGDKVETDILCARYAGMRCALSQFYDRSDPKWESQSRIDPKYFKLHTGPYMGSDKLELAEFYMSLEAFMTPEELITQWSDLEQVAERLQAKEFAWRPIVVGILLPNKKFETLRKMRCMELLDMPVPFRRDVILKRIDLTKPLEEQGPFDIIISKLMYWRVAESYDEKSALEMQRWDKYYKTLFTQFDLKDKYGKPLYPYSVDLGNLSATGVDMGNTTFHEILHQKTCKKHFTYIAGGKPEEIDKLNDRWHVIYTINKANITVQHPKTNLNISLVFPTSLLLKGSEIKRIHALYKQFGTKAFEVSNSSTEKKLTTEDIEVQELVEQIKKLKFPLYAKPRQSGSSHVSQSHKHKEVGHHLYIVPDIDTLISGEILDGDLDWIVQEYIDHDQMCHKVYALGCHIFASVNDSTPNVADIISMNKDDEKTQSNDESTDVASSSLYRLKPTQKGVVFVNSKKVSKRQHQDQSKIELWKDTYIDICKQLRNILQIDLFGVDIVFDSKNQDKMYVVDLNHFPSYKSVQNFHSVFWHYILWQYRECIMRGNFE